MTSNIFQKIDSRIEENLFSSKIKNNYESRAIFFFRAQLWFPCKHFETTRKNDFRCKVKKRGGRFSRAGPLHRQSASRAVQQQERCTAVRGSRPFAGLTSAHTKSTRFCRARDAAPTRYTLTQYILHIYIQIYIHVHPTSEIYTWRELHISRES